LTGFTFMLDWVDGELKWIADNPPPGCLETAAVHHRVALKALRALVEQAADAVRHRDFAAAALATAQMKEVVRTLDTAIRGLSLAATTECA
jgi:hypothetical protein